MLPSDYVISSLATLMGNEPKEDALLGYTVCGLIVRNRVLAGWEGGNWLRVINKHDTYSATAPMPVRTMVFGDPNFDTIFRRCLGIAENIFNGRERDITEGALFYCRLDTCSEDFSERIIRSRNQTTGLQDHPMIARIGLQMCFK